MTLAPVQTTHADAVTVRPGRPLSGTVRVDGSKNAALPLLAAAASLGRTVHLAGLPASADVQLMLNLLEQCGYRVAHPVLEPDSAVVMPRPGAIPAPVMADAARIRASYYLVVPLLAACGQATLPWPGGCRIGDRGMELHFRVYEAFGDSVAIDDDGYRVTAAETVPDTVVVELPFRSRGASIAAILRSVAAGRRLELVNPNLSPETVSVLTALRGCGWKSNQSEEKITLVPPRDGLSDPASWTVPGDKIEAGTLACAIAATGGEGRIEGVTGSDLTHLATLLDRVGIPATLGSDSVTIHRPTQVGGLPLRAVATLTPGGLDADFEPGLIALGLGLSGTHLFADAINPGRHGNLIPELARLGAKIEESSSTECRLTGPQRLTGTQVEATDIRTGSALIIAGLTARGTTTVTGLGQLRRGHADLPAKLRLLGADITEVPR